MGPSLCPFSRTKSTCTTPYEPVLINPYQPAACAAIVRRAAEGKIPLAGDCARGGKTAARQCCPPAGSGRYPLRQHNRYRQPHCDSWYRGFVRLSDFTPPGRRWGSANCTRRKGLSRRRRDGRLQRTDDSPAQRAGLRRERGKKPWRRNAFSCFQSSLRRCPTTVAVRPVRASQ